MEEFAEEDVTVREGLFGDESVAAVVLERVPECGRFSCALGGVEVSSGLNDLSNLLVSMSKTNVCLLSVHCSEFGTKVGLSNTEIYEMLVMRLKNEISRSYFSCA